MYVDAGLGLRTGWGEGICGESGLGKSSVRSWFVLLQAAVIEFIEEEWQTFDVKDFGEFDADEWAVIFTASRLKAIYLIIKSLKEKGILTFDEFC